MSNSIQQAWSAVKRILRYLKGAIDYKSKLSVDGVGGFEVYADLGFDQEP